MFHPPYDPIEALRGLLAQAPDDDDWSKILVALREGHPLIPRLESLRAWLRVLAERFPDRADARRISWYHLPTRMWYSDLGQPVGQGAMVDRDGALFKGVVWYRSSDTTFLDEKGTVLFSALPFPPPSPTGVPQVAPPPRPRWTKEPG